MGDLIVRVTVVLPDGGQHTVVVGRDFATNPGLHWDEVAAAVEEALPKLTDAVAAVYGRRPPAVPQSKLAKERAQ